VDGRAAELVPKDVRVHLGQDLVARLGEDAEGDLVRHGRGGKEDGLLLAEELGDALLERDHRRVLSLLLVADDGLGDRLTHPRGRLGNSVRAEVDHGVNGTGA
jgi:hypothetical protein